MARGVHALLPPIEVVEASYCNANPEDRREWEVSSLMANVAQNILACSNTFLKVRLCACNLLKIQSCLAPLVFAEGFVNNLPLELAEFQAQQVRFCAMRIGRTHKILAKHVLK